MQCLHTCSRGSLFNKLAWEHLRTCKLTVHLKPMGTSYAVILAIKQTQEIGADHVSKHDIESRYCRDVSYVTTNVKLLHRLHYVRRILFLNESAFS